METFLMGAMAMASGIAGIFFLKFWRDTGDRLFAIFAAAFWLLGMTRVALAATTSASLDEGRHYIYLIRLAAFVLILIAIINKNRPQKSTA